MYKISKKILKFGLISIILLGFIIVPSYSAKISSKFINKNTLIFEQENSAYDLLIIAPKNFYNLLIPLKSHKEKYDVSTRIVTLSEIYKQEYWGRDNAEKIKFYIRDAYDNWAIKYVLLVGGLKGQNPNNNWHLPVRYIHMGNDWESEILSDLYFADIYDSEGHFSSWDSDGDGLYAEWYKGDQPEDIYHDLKPEIAIGRLPCRNKFEVRIMINKIIEYETGTYGKSWFYDMLVIAGDTYPEFKNPLWIGYEGEYYGDLAIENMTGFNPTRLYTSDGTLTHYKDIIKNYKKGFGFVYFVGHGSPFSWSNHLPNSSKRIESLVSYHMPLLTNKNKLPICLLSGCHNLQFDVNIFNIFDKKKRIRGEYTPESMGWWMTRKINGGSIATIGCTALGYTKEDKVLFKGGINELEVQFFHQYGKGETKILGELWTDAINWYTDTYKVNWNLDFQTEDSWIDSQVVQTWILFGDPSLKIEGYE